MLSIEFLKGQGLGNQLWNYSSLRAISEKLGYGFRINGANKFKGLEFLDIDFSSPEIVDFKSKTKNIFYETLYYDHIQKTFVSNFDKEILKIKENTEIKGLFQSEKYFFNKDINKYIKLKNEYKSYKYEINKVCIMNIRGGEYKRFKNLILPKKYWTDAIKNMRKFDKNIEFKIVTDDENYASKLFPEYKIIKGNIESDFLEIYFAKFLIVSNSSFSYFPISLGDKPEVIIAPAHWARFANEEEKWISPANYYKKWLYQDKEGHILRDKKIKDSIRKTNIIYSNYNIKTSINGLKNNDFKKYIPESIKKIIKIFLSKLFPLNFG